MLVNYNTKGVGRHGPEVMFVELHPRFGCGKSALYNPPAMRRQGIHSLLSFALVTAVVARSLIAPGFMPDAGGIQLCHSGLDDRQVVLLLGHHAAHAGPGDSGAPTSDDLCELGNGLSSASITTNTYTPAEPPRSIRPLDPAAVRISAPRIRGFDPRAPPVDRIRPEH